MSTPDDFKWLNEHLKAIRAMDEARQSIMRASDLERQLSAGNKLLQQTGVDAALKAAFETNRSIIELSQVSRIASPTWLVAESVIRQMETMRPARELVDVVAHASRFWQAQLPASETLKQMSGPLTALEGHLASIARVTEISRLLASRLNFESVGQALSVAVSARDRLIGSFERLTGAYEGFYAMVSKSEAAMLALPPTISARPAIEFFNAVYLLETTTGEPLESELDAEREATQAEIRTETRDHLAAALAARFPDLVEPLQGARVSLDAKQPDYVRHAITSLRELFTQLLHRLAPDDAINAWSKSKDDYSNGRPTRAARLRYICRNVDQGQLSEFVKKDIADMLAIIDVFQGGTHGMKSEFTEIQLRAILARTEGAFHFLLTITGIY